MINEIKTLIIQQLLAVFGNVKVYDEPIQQGLNPPAFLLLVFNNTQEPAGLSSRVQRTYSINITYFPSTSDKRTECDDVLETIQNNFRTLGKRVRIPRIEGTFHDDVLVITFNIAVHLREVLEGIKMLTLTQEGFIRD